MSGCVREGRLALAARRVGALACALLSLGLSARAAFAIEPMVRNVLMVDRQTDPLGQGSASGGVFLIRPGEQSPVRLAAFPRGLNDPWAMEVLPDRTFLVVDASADPLGLGTDTGAIFRVDPRQDLLRGTVELVAASSLFYDPVDILIEPEGTYLVIDTNADPHRQFNLPGALFRVDPSNHGVQLLAAEDDWFQPRGLAWATNGDVLVVDPAADPTHTHQNWGAIYRVNRTTGVVTLEYSFTRPRFLSPSAIVTLGNGDLLVLDKDADPNSTGNAPGCVFKLPILGGNPIVFITDEQFVEPTDMHVGLDNDLYVVDTAANPQNSQTARGALFRFDLATGRKIGTFSSSLFRAPSGVTQIAGAELDSSIVRWQDDSQGLAQPGDIFTVRARIRNSGTFDARPAALKDTLATAWQYVPGSDSTGRGEITYQSAGRIVSWESDLAVGEEETVRFRIRLADNAELNRPLRQELSLEVDGASARFNVTVTPRRAFAPGTAIFGDFLRVGGVEQGVIYAVNPDSIVPTRLWSGAPLVRPSDLVFLEDQRLAILDTRAFPDRPAGPEAVFLFAGGGSASTTFDTLLVRRAGDGLVSPQGLALDRNGDLLLIDKDANPAECETPNPGAVFRLSLRTGDLTVLFSDCRMTEPLDADVDTQNRVIVTDYNLTQPGNIFQYDRISQISSPLPVAPIFFQDPLAIAIDRAGNPIVADLTANPLQLEGNTGIVFRIRRGEELAYELVSQDTRFRDPNSLAIASDGRIYVTDREADPLQTGDRDPGAVFVLDPSVAPARVSVVAATPTLNLPDGMAVLQSPDLSASRFNIFDLNGGRVEPADTLRFRLALINSSPRAASQAYIEFSVSEEMDLLQVAGASGIATADARLNRGSWTGRVGGYDTLFVNVRAAVRPTATYGTNAIGIARIQAGGPSTTVSASLPIRAAFAAGEVLLADERADPTRVGGDPGAIFRVDAQNGGARYLFSSAQRRQPSALEWTPDGQLMLGYKNGTDPGGVYLFDTATGALNAVVEGDPRLRSPVDLSFDAHGDLFVVDDEVPGSTPGAIGAVYRLRQGQAPLELFAADSTFRAPQQIAFLPDGECYLTDRSANPGRDSGLLNPAAIYHLDPATGSVEHYFSDRGLPEPVGLIAYTDSSLIITDQAANPYGLPLVTGALLEYVPARDALRTYLAGSFLVQPRKSLLLPNGSTLVLDRGAKAPNQRNGSGGVLEYVPARSSVTYHTFSDSFRVVSDLAYLPASYLRFTSYSVTDVNGPPLYSADRVRVEATFVNTGRLPALEATFVDSLTPETTLLASTVESSSGSIVADAGVVRWIGDVPPGATVTLRYEAQLDPFRSAGKLLGFHGTLVDDETGTKRQEVDLPVQVPFEPGFLYLADTDADPYGFSGAPGAIFKVDVLTGFTVPFFSSRRFRAPRDLALVQGTRPRILVLDQQARAGVGLGSLFSLDPATQELTFIASDSSWAAPTQVYPISEDEVYVLDSFADPFHLTPGTGPGALYRVRLSTGLVTPVFSDTTFRAMTSMVVERSGFLLITDADADPLGFGNRNGAVFRVDLEGRTVQTFASSPQWETPTASLLRNDGSLLVVDKDAQPGGSGLPRGAIFNVRQDGRVALLSASRYFRALSNAVFRSDGNPILSDADADPFNLGERYGCLHDWNAGVIGLFGPLASTKEMRRPAGLFHYQDLTPVSPLELTAETAEGGIRILFNGPEDAPGARYLVYRRDASGPDDLVLPEDPERYTLLDTGAPLEGGGPHRWLDTELSPNGWYVYLLARVGEGGGLSFSSPVLAQAPAQLYRFALIAPAPNPFRAQCQIACVLPTAGEVELALYDVTGRRVRDLSTKKGLAGFNRFLWDGRNDAGRTVGAGIYFVRLQHAAGQRTARVVRLP